MPKLNTQLDVSLITKACGALILHEEKKVEGKSSLLGNYARPILAQIELVNSIKKPVLRPIRVKIPYSLFSSNDEDHNICFFCKSDDKDDIVKYIDDNPIDGLKTIVSINEVKKLYNAFKDRKKLLSEHTHFVCDARVMGQLYNLLGKVFLDRNHHPIPIDFKETSDLPNAIMKIVDSTYMHLKGKNIAIRFGHTAMKQDKITQNIIHGLQFAAAKIPSGGWNNIQNIVLKTPDSAALPIFNKDKEKNKEVSNFMKSKGKVDDDSDSKASKGKSKKEDTKKQQIMEEVQEEEPVVTRKRAPPAAKKIEEEIVPKKIPRKAATAAAVDDVKPKKEVDAAAKKVPKKATAAVVDDDVKPKKVVAAKKVPKKAAAAVVDDDVKSKKEVDAAAKKVPKKAAAAVVDDDVKPKKVVAAKKAKK